MHDDVLCEQDCLGMLFTKFQLVDILDHVSLFKKKNLDHVPYSSVQGFIGMKIINIFLVPIKINKSWF